jgi:hypothetical protein
MPTPIPTENSRPASNRYLSKPEQVKEIVKCGRDPVYFINNYIKIRHPEKGLIKFDTFPFQDTCVRDFQKHDYNIILKSRQLGMSTLAAAYVVWYCIFYKDKTTLVVATKLSTATNFIKKVKIAIQNLPSWLLLPKIKSDKAASVEFSNGSSVTATSTSEDAGRSESLSMLIIDECVAKDTFVTVRNKVTGEIKRLEIGELYELLNVESNQSHEQLNEM